MALNLLALSQIFCYQLTSLCLPEISCFLYWGISWFVSLERMRTCFNMSFNIVGWSWRVQPVSDTAESPICRETSGKRSRVHCLQTTLLYADRRELWYPYVNCCIYLFLMYCLGYSVLFGFMLCFYACSDVQDQNTNFIFLLSLCYFITVEK